MAISHNKINNILTKNKSHVLIVGIVITGALICLVIFTWYIRIHVALLQQDLQTAENYALQNEEIELEESRLSNTEQPLELSEEEKHEIMKRLSSNGTSSDAEGVVSEQLSIEEKKDIMERLEVSYDEGGSPIAETEQELTFEEKMDIMANLNSNQTVEVKE